MIAITRIKDGSGKFVSATPADCIFIPIMQSLATYGWAFTRMWMSRACLRMAENASEQQADADRWIERYRALRLIQ